MSDVVIRTPVQTYIVSDDESLDDHPASIARAVRRARRERRDDLLPELQAICFDCSEYLDELLDWVRETAGESMDLTTVQADPRMRLPACRKLGRKRCCGKPDVVPLPESLRLAYQSGRCPDGRWDEVLNRGDD